MDNLANDAINAVRAGMTYGRWKALHPHTIEEADAAVPNGFYEKTCAVCGKHFVAQSWNAKYCSDDCWRGVVNSRNLRRHHMKKTTTE